MDRYESATCAISGKSGKNLPMDLNQPGVMLKLRKLGFGVIHCCRFQIWDQVLQIHNIFVDIRCKIFN